MSLSQVRLVCAVSTGISVSASSTFRTAFSLGSIPSSPRSIPTTGAFFETRDEYFDYYRGYHAFWKLYGIDLPDAVLKKVDYQNALKLMKGVPASGFPR